MLSVGIWGASGYMGAQFSRALLKAHRSGLLRFVILHRPEANLGRYPEDIEKRLLDLEGSDVANTAEAVKDLQIVISAMPVNAMEAQYRLIDALKGSEQLVTFFPSEYATPHHPKDLEGPYLVHGLRKEKVREYCKLHGVPCTVLANATTPDVLFSMVEFSSFHARENKLELYWPLGDGTRGLTSKEFSGQALVHLLLHRLAELPNRAFSLVEIPFTAQDLIALFTKIHNGQEPTIIKYTEEKYQQDLHQSFLGAMTAARNKGLTVGVKWPGEIVSTFPGWQERTLEEYVKESLASKPLNLGNYKDSTDLSRD